MPRNVDPSTITVGAGRVSDGTVEDSSLRYPDRDTEPLRVHIHDPVRAHMASTIGIVDAAGCYTSDEVEGALQEICAGAGAGRLNGLVAGGTFVEAIPGPDLTLTLVAGTTILINAHAFDAGGLTVSLPDAAVDYFIYFDTLSSSGTYETLQYTVGTPPEVETAAGVEQVMIAKVSCDGAGNTTVYQDARFFVRNLDRKVQYSSRQGENVDAWSEGCFVTLQAAMFWLEHYSNSITSEEQKGTIIVRGRHVITDTLSIPVDNVIFQGGSPDAEFQLSANSARTMIDLNDKSQIVFRDLIFNCATPWGAPNKAVSTPSTAGSEGLVFENCLFKAAVAGQEWDTCIALDTDGTNKNQRLTVTNCKFMGCFRALEVDSAEKVWVTDCTMKGTLPSKADAMWFTKAGAHDPSEVNVSRCHIEDFQTGFSASELSNSSISYCRMVDVGQTTGRGIYINGDSSSYVVVDNNYVQLEDSDGMVGIEMKGQYHTVSACNIWNQRLIGAYNPADLPTGISFSTVGAQFNRVTGCTIRNFLNSNVPLDGKGRAVYVEYDSFDFSVVDCKMVGSGVEFGVGPVSSISARRANISNNLITGGGTYGSHKQQALVLLGEPVEGVTVSGNTLDCSETAKEAIKCSNIGTVLNSSPSRNILVSGNSVIAVLEAGILIEGNVKEWNLTGNSVDGWLNTAIEGTCKAIWVRGHATGSSIQQPTDGAISSNTLIRAKSGIIVEGVTHTKTVDNVTISGNNIAECAASVTVLGTGKVADVFDDLGAMGIGLWACEGVLVSGNSMDSLGAWAASTTLVLPGGDSQCLGIFARGCSQISIMGNRIGKMFANGTAPQDQVFTQPIRVDAQSMSIGGASIRRYDSIKISDNQICLEVAPSLGTARCAQGIYVAAQEGTDTGVTYSLRGVDISNNSVQNLELDTALATLLDADCSGVRVFKDNGGSIINLSVGTNLISDVLGLGVDVWATSAASPRDSKIWNASIRGNTIRGSIGNRPLEGAGVRLYTQQGGEIQTASVSDNSVYDQIDVGVMVMATTSTSGGPGPACRIADVQVSNNNVNIGGTGATGGGTTPTGVQVKQIDINAEVIGVSVLGNKLGGAYDGTPLQYGVSYETSTQSEHIRDLSICENTVFVGMEAVTNKGVSVASGVEALSALGAVCTNLTISDNSITCDIDDPNYGVSVFLEGYEINGASIQGNQHHSLQFTNFQVGLAISRFI